MLIDDIFPLLDLQKQVTFHTITKEPPDSELIQKARKAAENISKSGIHTFSENSSDIDFIKEVCAFLDSLIDQS